MILRRILAGLAAGTVVLALGASTAQADPATMSSDPRIIGGSNARITEVPWQVALLRAGSGSGLDRQFCGGSILSAEWILTAAHCLAPDPRTSTVTDASAIIVTSGTDDLTAAGLVAAANYLGYLVGALDALRATTVQRAGRRLFGGLWVGVAITTACTAASARSSSAVAYPLAVGAASAARLRVDL